MQEHPLIDQPAGVRAGEDLDRERLAAYLAEHLPDVAGPLEIEQFPGGMSNLTYFLRMGTQEMVLRRPPFGANIRGGHDMGREYRILSALIRAYPKVPRPLVYCEDQSVLGAPFYVMERVRGVVLRSTLQPEDAPAPDEMRRICLALIDTQAELHAIDYVAAGLGELGKPEGYVARQVAGWAKRYHNARTDDCPNLEPLIHWLVANQPTRSDAALIHNDFRYDNVILDPTNLARIIAILDWELATLGDPLTDVGTTLAYWSEPGDPPELRQFGLTSLPGNLDRRGFLERYAEKSGRDVSNILFYYVYGQFKNAVILQQIYARFRQGHTQDKRFARLVHVVGVCGNMAERAIERNRIDQLFA